MFTLAFGFADMTACAAASTYFGLTPSSSGYDTTIVPVRPLAWLGAAEPTGVPAGVQATARPDAAATLRNVRREYLLMSTSLRANICHRT